MGVALLEDMSLSEENAASLVQRKVCAVITIKRSFMIGMTGPNLLDAVILELVNTVNVIKIKMGIVLLTKMERLKDIALVNNYSY